MDPIGVSKSNVRTSLSSILALFKALAESLFTNFKIKCKSSHYSEV